MNPPRPILPSWLRAELAPRRGRRRQSLAIATASTAALAIAVALQFGSFPAPLLGFKGLLPSCVCTWRALLPRLAVIAGAAVVAVFAAGMLVQVPWLLLPVLFVALTAVTYVVPISQSPIRGYAIVLTLAGVFYTAVFAPQDIGRTALGMAVAFAIGITVATLAAALGATESPRAALAAALADSFDRVRAQVREAEARFRAPAFDAASGDSSTLSGLAQHVQLLARVKQDLHDPDVERAFVALITAAERAATFGALADNLSRQAGGRVYRRLLDAELAALLDAIDSALARFSAAAAAPETIVTADALPAEPARPWPDFPALVAALQVRQQALAAGGDVAAVEVAESVTLNGFVQALEGLADVLHLPPEALEHAPRPDEAGPRPWLPPFDPYAAQFAAKIALACVLALIVGVASHVRSLETCILNPLILAQGSYGATIRKTGLRLAGVVGGGGLAVLTVIAVMANTDDLAVWLLLFFALMLPCAYVALGSPRLSYLGVQIGATYMIVLVANAPVVDVHEALWRFFGTVLGALILFAVFEVVAPDYAGRQIVSRFSDLLRDLLASLPEADGPVAPVAQTRALGDRIVTGLGDVLRLADEARYEGARSGVDPSAAVDAAGILRRISHRWALVRRGRRSAARPPLPVPTQAALTGFELAARQRLERLARLVAARHHRARVGSGTHHAACRAARATGSQPAADLAAPLAAVIAGVDALRAAGTLASWSREAADALLAEVGHLQRVAQLLPKLETEIVRMLLPDEPAAIAVEVRQPAYGEQHPLP